VRRSGEGQGGADALVKPTDRRVAVSGEQVLALAVSQGGRMSEFKFAVGDRVRKPKGYRFDAVVLSVFRNLSGEARVVAENGDGLLHIFNEGQLESA
jgi:hypothetical protein